MAEISIGAAVGEGFDLIRRKPLSVVSWGLIQILFSALVLAVLSPVFLSSFGELARQAQSGLPPSPANMQGMIQMELVSYLLDIIGLFVNAIFYCAIFRAVIHPNQNRFAYLRVGPPELFLGLLMLGALFAFMIGMVVAMIPIMIVVFALVATHLGAVAAIFGVVAAIAAFVALIYLALRVSLVGPMMVDDGKFHLGEAWALTKGKVWSLFAVALVISLILMAAELVIGLILVAVGLGVVSSVAGGLSNLPVFFQQSPRLIVGKLAPLLIVLAVVWVPLSGCLLAIMGAPWARAYCDLRPKRDIAETFA